MKTGSAECTISSSDDEALNIDVVIAYLLIPLFFNSLNEQCEEVNSDEGVQWQMKTEGRVRRMKKRFESLRTYGKGELARPSLQISTNIFARGELLFFLHLKSFEIRKTCLIFDFWGAKQGR